MLGLLVEFLIRKLYFSFPQLSRLYKARQTCKTKQQSKACRCQFNLPELKALLQREIIAEADLMLHSSYAAFIDLLSPQDILTFFEAYGANRTTLLLPSHPKLKLASDGILEYNPAYSPSTVGLIPELARRKSNYKRSLHPFSSVLAHGPATDYYLSGNLNHDKPLPHGKDSPYKRLAERNGFAVCLGIPFIKSLTMIHVAEETLDTDFPIWGIFEEVRVRVIQAYQAEAYIVRRRKLDLVAHVSMHSIEKDLLKNKLVRRFTIGGINIDIADCQAIVEYMTIRGRENGYPYMFLPSYPRQKHQSTT